MRTTTPHAAPTRIDWPVTSDAEMVDALALFSPFKAWMPDAHIPRTSSPVRFDYLRVSVWCAPRHRFQAVTYSN
jgi:hypothetical protein